MELHAIDEGGNVRGTGTDRRWIEVGFETIEFAGSGSEIERQVFTLLKDADLSLSLARDAAGSNVRHRAGGERHARIGDVQRWRQHRHANR